MARANRNYLRNLHAVFKEFDEHIQFTFIPGVSKFSKVNLFSGMNNLRDITIDSKYSSICGYTDNDVDEVFSPELQGMDHDKIRESYNGYN